MSPQVTGKGRTKWYGEHPCEHRFRIDPHGYYICETLKEGCFRVISRGGCPQGIKLPPKQETLASEPGRAVVTVPRDIPAGTYELKRVGA